MKKDYSQGVYRYACSAIINDLRLGEKEEQHLVNQEGFDEILAYLEKIIAYMVDHDFERLMQAFYRIDLAEGKVKHILFSGEVENVAKELAISVLERELQKGAMREMYSRK